MTSREKFEAWAKDNGMSLVYGDCDYVYSPTVWAWKAWQAAETSMAAHLANAESKCRELAAENVTLNDKMNKLATWPGIEFYSSAWAFCNLDGSDALEFMCDVKTPATDAFLAEVRAQESKRVYESILDNPAVTDMASLVDWLEQNANDSVAFAAQLRKGAAL